MIDFCDEHPILSDVMLEYHKVILLSQKKEAITMYLLAFCIRLDRYRLSPLPTTLQENHIEQEQCYTVPLTQVPPCVSSS